MAAVEGPSENHLPVAAALCHLHRRPPPGVPRPAAPSPPAPPPRTVSRRTAGRPGPRRQQPPPPPPAPGSARALAPPLPRGRGGGGSQNPAKGASRQACGGCHAGLACSGWERRLTGYRPGKRGGKAKFGRLENEPKAGSGSRGGTCSAPSQRHTRLWTFPAAPLQ